MTLFEEAQGKIKDKTAFARWLCELMELSPKDGCEVCPAKDACSYGWNGFRTLLDKPINELWEVEQ